MSSLRSLFAAAVLAAACAAAGCQAGPVRPAAPDDAAPAPDVFHLLAFTTSGSVGDPVTGRHGFNESAAKISPWQYKNNSRSCATCHILSDGMGLGRQSAYDAGPTNPLITGLLADGDPDVDFASPYGQKLKALMLDQLREVGLIRIVLPNPNFVEAEGENAHNPRFIRTFRSVPTVFNSALGLAENEPTASGGAMSAFVMWDGREPSLEHQAASATMGHAQSQLQLPKNAGAAKTRTVMGPLAQDIAAFEKRFLSTPRALASMRSVRPVVNHALDGTPFAGAPVFDMATVQKKFFSTVKLTTDAQRRGMAAFTGTPQHPACIVCHNAPETLAGGTRLFASDNIGEENVQLRLHAPDAATKALMTEFGYGFEEGDTVQKLPMQTIRLKNAYGGYEEVTAQDFGLAGQTGMLKDLHQYKIPQLRNIKTYTRFFHDNYDETTLSGVVQHYRDAFPAIFGTMTDADRDDLVEFLKAL